MEPFKAPYIILGGIVAMKLYSRHETSHMCEKLCYHQVRISKNLVFKKLLAPYDAKRNVYMRLYSLDVRIGKTDFYNPYTISSNHMLRIKEFFPYNLHLFNFIMYPKCNKLDEILIQKFMLQDYHRYKEKYKYHMLNNQHIRVYYI